MRTGQPARGTRRAQQTLWRLRTMLWPILETAGAAVTAWYLAKLLLPERETAFAPIAAVICLGAAMGQQRERGFELMGGVILGVLIADLLVRVLGTGPPQVGLMVVLAMSGAVLVGGGSLFMTEAGVSAIIIGSTAPSTLGLFPVRPVEGLIGGAVAFALHALVFPPDPLRHVGQAANAVFSSLGRTLQDLASALRTGDREQAERALEQARSIDGAVRALGDALALGRDTARSSPLRRPARAALDRQEEISRHLDFAVRNTRVLARDAVRYARRGGSPVLGIADAVGDLAEATWALAAVFDDPGARDDPRSLALRAAGRASEAMARSPDLTITEIAGQVRSTAVDLVRASQAAAGDETESAEASTEEMLAVALDTSSSRPESTPPDT